MTMREEHEFVLQHTQTPLYDHQIKVTIDRKKRFVLIVSENFDSWLVGRFIVNCLPE